MLHQEAKRNLLGDFEGALDFVHGLDAAGAVGGGNVHRRRAGASPFVVGVQRRVHRVQRDAAGPEPVGDLADVLLAVGVVEMLAGGENLDRLRAAAHQAVQQAGMQALFDVHVGGHAFSIASLMCELG